MVRSYEETELVQGGSATDLEPCTQRALWTVTVPARPPR